MKSCKCLNLIEVGIIDCGYGCKVVRCEKCNKEYNSHRVIYGCLRGTDIKR